MALISDKDRDAIKQRFDNELVNDVKLIYFTQGESPLPAQTQECAMCRETREILEEISSLSDKLSLEVHDFYAESELATQMGVEKIPAIVLSGVRGDRARFYGIPSGYEFPTLIEDIIDVSKGTSGLAEKNAARVAAIVRPVHIQVFVTPTWPYCPGAARLAHKLAMENPNIVGDVVEATEFPLLNQRYNVMSVPKTVVNDSVEFVGAYPEDRFVSEVIKALG